jgi:hypothetical protein
MSYKLKDISWKCLKCNGDNSEDYKCYNCEELNNKLYPSWSNIKYHLPIIKHFVNIISNITMEIESKRYEKDCEEMNKKYVDYALEDDDFKFIWGIKSYDDLSSSDCNMMTMNDIDIVYDKKKKLYCLGIETAYIFEDKQGECNYLKGLLNAFTNYMDKNGLNKNEPYMLFFSNPCTDTSAKTIEELYTNFRIFVEGYCKVYGGDK